MRLFSKQRLAKKAFGQLPYNLRFRARIYVKKPRIRFYDILHRTDDIYQLRDILNQAEILRMRAAAQQQAVSAQVDLVGLMAQRVNSASLGQQTALGQQQTAYLGMGGLF